MVFPMEEHFRHKVNRRLADKDVDLNKNGKPVIASNINVFCFIITNEMVSICVLHFTKVYCMHKRTKIIKKKMSHIKLSPSLFWFYKCCF